MHLLSREWVYGCLLNNLWTYSELHPLQGQPVTEIIVTGEADDWETVDEELKISVDSKTVGQFTGVTDNFHRDVYEGDIFQTGQGSLFVVNWNEEECQWTALCFSGDHQGVFYLKKFMGENMEVIGNIHENSDLLLNR